MLHSIFSSAGSVVTIVVGIGFLIFVHELGHFIMAKKSKVRVEAFSLGFGPTLFSFTRGETEYRLSAFPLGGYVKMAGENVSDEDYKPKEYEFLAKTPFTRIKIILAGVSMNFIFAFIFCILAYFIGINFIAPQVGMIRTGSAEAEAGIKPNDIITHFDAQKIESLDDYNRAIIRAELGTSHTIGLLRDNKEITATVIAQGTKKLGVVSKTNIIADTLKNSAAMQAGLKANDEIIEINDTPILITPQIEEKIKYNTKENLLFKVKHSDGSIEAITVTPPSVYKLDIAWWVPPVIGKIVANSPAEKAGLKNGDIIMEINHVAVSSWNKMHELIRANGNKPINLLIKLSNTETKSVEITPMPDDSGKGIIGVNYNPSNIIGEVPSDSVLALAGLKPGDVIIQADDKNVKDLNEVEEIANNNQKGIIKLLIKRNDETVNLQVALKTANQGDIGIIIKSHTIRQKYPMGRAIVAGITETWDFLGLTFQFIWKLVKHDESPKGLAGPVGIIQASYLMAQEGISKFLWLLALFSVNLVIINLLPIPIMDGGLILFTLIERIKGSPVNIKIQIVSQYIGLFLILSLVLFVTYNDIHRLIFGLYD